MILSAQSIRAHCEGPLLKLVGAKPLIEPFHERAQSMGRSYGLSSCGYDVRLAQDIWLWPFYGRLGSIIEHINMPNDLCAEVKDKSTNARMFVTVQNTIVEPGWDGYLTIELTRHLPWPIFLRRGLPIAQLIFKKLDHPTAQPYLGKYSHQKAEPQKARLT